MLPNYTRLYHVTQLDFSFIFLLNNNYNTFNIAINCTQLLVQLIYKMLVPGIERRKFYSIRRPITAQSIFGR